MTTKKNERANARALARAARAERAAQAAPAKSGWETDWRADFTDDDYEEVEEALPWAINQSGQIPPPRGLVDAAVHVGRAARVLKGMYPAVEGAPATTVASLLVEAFGLDFVADELRASIEVFFVPQQRAAEERAAQQRAG